MVPYFGLPITPQSAAVAAINGGHALVSYRHPEQLGVAIECAQSFVVDNGAFSAWKSGEPVKDWSGYYAWAAECLRVPSCDWAVIPDVIDGNEADNDALLAEWPMSLHQGVPVWHMHESMARLERLSADWPRIAIGSSGQYRQPGSVAWWQRMSQAMAAVCDSEGRPLVRIHGLRMLAPEIVRRLPMASADSSSIGRNVGIDVHWRGGIYTPPSKESRALLMRQRVEALRPARKWNEVPHEQLELIE